MMKQFYEHKFPPQFIRKLIEVKDNVSSNATEYCKRNLEYRAEVIFRMATDSVTVTVMSSRLSFFDMMSSFGNTYLMSNCVKKCILMLQVAH